MGLILYSSNLTQKSYTIYRGIIPNDKNLPLTQFRHLRQLLGRSCSYLLPRQDGGISQNYVSGRFLPFGMVPLYKGGFLPSIMVTLHVHVSCRVPRVLPLPAVRVQHRDAELHLRAEHQLPVDGELRDERHRHLQGPTINDVHFGPPFSGLG